MTYKNSWSFVEQSVKIGLQFARMYCVSVALHPKFEFRLALGNGNCFQNGVFNMKANIGFINFQNREEKNQSTFSKFSMLFYLFFFYFLFSTSLFYFQSSTFLLLLNIHILLLKLPSCLFRTSENSIIWLANSQCIRQRTPRKLKIFNFFLFAWRITHYDKNFLWIALAHAQWQFFNAMQCIRSNCKPAFRLNSD